MKRLLACAAILAFVPGTALAADPSPIGDWRVKDGYANIRIDNCGGKMWGIVAWEKAAGKDIENPDPAKKGRPTLGMPILLAMAPTKPNRWEGEIYNSNNGKVYSSNISMVDENTLKLEGCWLGFLCGGENWTRVTAPPVGGASLPQVGSQVNLNKQVNSQKKGAGAQSDVCARVASETGSTR